MQRCLSLVIVVSFFVVTFAPVASAGPGDCLTWVTDLNAQGTRLTANADDSVTLIVAVAKSGEGAAAGIIIQPRACNLPASPTGQVEQIERQAGLPNAFDAIPSNVPGGHGAPIPFGLPTAPSLP